MSTKSLFRMYGKVRSSCFDFFHNDLEPAQTKGLGYLLAKSDEAKKIFCKLLKQNNLTLKEYNLKWIVDCELFGEKEHTPFRLDILIRLYSEQNVPQYAFLLEAKNVNRKMETSKVEEQLDEYIKVFEKEIQSFSEKNIYGIILTRSTTLVHEKNETKHIYISWEQLLKELIPLADKSDLIGDYVNFIISNMETKFYTDEVLSIAAGKTIGRVKKDRIYMCQAERFKKMPLFITFRESSGGKMNHLYRIRENIPSIDCKNPAVISSLTKKYPDLRLDIKINNWIAEEDKDEVRQGRILHQLIILDVEKKDIVLPYPVMPERNNVDRAGWSFLLSDFFQKPSPEENVVILSKKNK